MKFITASKKLLSDDEAKQLLKEAQNGSSDAMTNLVEANLRLVASVARRFQNMGKEYEDIFQVGCLGLVKAINNFDLSYAVCFSTYAVPLIMGEIRRYIRDDMPVSVSRSIKENAQLVKRGRDDIIKETGSEPTIKQLADKLAMLPEQVTLALESMRPLSSIYDTVFHDDGDPVYLLDYLSSDDRTHENLDKLYIDELLSNLTEKQRQVIELRFTEDKTQSEIGEILNISQVQVSRIERTALDKLRELSKKNG